MNIAVKINAKNDSNGNPRRGWIVYDATGNISAFVDEGYSGSGALAEAGYIDEHEYFRMGVAAARKIGAAPLAQAAGEDIPVTPGFYRAMKRKYASKPKKNRRGSRRTKRTSRKRTSRRAR